MKKLFTLALALLMVAALATTAFAEVHLTVTSWRVEDQAAWDEINAAFTAEHPDITLEYLPVTATEYDGVLQTKLASGNAEDIMFLRSFSTGLQIYNAGYIYDLTEDKVPNLAVMADSMKAPWTKDGVTYGMPGSVCYGGFFYNKAIFEEVGVEAPRTFEEFMTVCQKIKDAGYIPIGFGIMDSWMVAEYLSASVVPAATGSAAWHDKLMAKEVDYLDPGYVKHFEWIKEMSKFFPDAYEGIGYSDMQMMFASGMSAIYPVGTFELTVIESLNPDLDLGWFYMPTETAENPYVINFGAIMGYGINKSVTDEEKLNACYTYINWLAEQKASEMFTNKVLGQYACSGNFENIENPVAAAMVADAQGAEYFLQIPYQKLSDQSPDYTSAIQAAIYKLLIEDCTPEEAAQFMMDEQAWYFAK